MEACNDCPFFTTTSVKAEDQVSSGYYNAYCKRSTSKSSKDSTVFRMIDLYVRKGIDVKKPKWCDFSMESSFNKDDKKKKILEIIPSIEWDDIKAQEIYHVPKILGEERLTIQVVNKFSYYLSYKFYQTNDSRIMYLYPSSPMAKCLIPYKRI